MIGALVETSTLPPKSVPNYIIYVWFYPVELHGGQFVDIDGAASFILCLPLITKVQFSMPPPRLIDRKYAPECLDLGRRPLGPRWTHFVEQCKGVDTLFGHFMSTTLKPADERNWHATRTPETQRIVRARHDVVSTGADSLFPHSFQLPS